MQALKCQIQQLVVHGPARGQWEIKGEATTILFEQNKNRSLEGFSGGADISGKETQLLVYHICS